MRREIAVLAVITSVLLGTGCTGDEADNTADPSPSSQTASAPTESSSGSAGDTTEPSTSPTPPQTQDSGQVIDITFKGDEVTPNGDRVEVTAGEPIELRVSADAPGEIHVHSSPEQQLEYGKGESTLSLTIDQPGVVEVESHELEKIIVQLEVRP